MLISKETNEALNEQIGRELASSHQYTNMAAYFDERGLQLLAKMFFDQADEERGHAMKLVRFLADAGGLVAIPAIPAARSGYSSVEEAVKQALDWELEITRHINDIMDLVVSKKDHAARAFLDWFVTEQVEEVKTMDDLLKVVQSCGERNIYMTEAYLAHIEAAD